MTNAQITYRRVLGRNDRIDHERKIVRFASGRTARLVAAHPGPEGCVVEYTDA